MPCARCTLGDSEARRLCQLEVSPYLAHRTKRPCSRRGALGAVDRPNLMIKVPATDEGIIRQLIGEGINVNVTLLRDRRMKLFPMRICPGSKPF